MVHYGPLLDFARCTKEWILAMAILDRIKVSDRQGGDMMKNIAVVIDEGDAATYYGLSELIRKEISQKVEHETAQAPEVYRTVVRNGVENLCEAMEAFKDSEVETIVSPLTWKQFISDGKATIDKALTDLGGMVGADSTDAKEAAIHQAEKVFNLTEKAVRSLDDSAEFFRKAEKFLKAKDEEVKESMRGISAIMTDLNELSQKDMPDEAKDAFARMLKESMEMQEYFQSLYEAAHKPTGKMVPGKVAELFEVASSSLKNVNADLRVCSYMKKAAVKEKDSSIYGFIASTASKITSRARDYMKALKNAKDKVYSKGKDINDNLRFLKPMLVASPVNSREAEMSRYLGSVGLRGPSPPDTLARMVVMEMMKDGLGKKEILENLARLGKTIKDAASDKKTLEMIDGKDAGR